MNSALNNFFNLLFIYLIIMLICVAAYVHCKLHLQFAFVALESLGMQTEDSVTLGLRF